MYWTKVAVVGIVVFIVLVPLLPFNMSLISNAEGTSVSDTYWVTLARNAWNYFAVGAAVNPNTGLANADIQYQYFTDWDIGNYIQAIVDAQKVGLINRTGAWGADDRLNRVLTFLENRQLTARGLPYCWYSSATGQFSVDQDVVVTDTGRLLSALNGVKQYDPSLTQRVNNIVYNRTNYQPDKLVVSSLLSDVTAGRRTASVYDYYVIRGFASFWPQLYSKEAVDYLSYIASIGTVTYQGVSLPKINNLPDPLLLCVFEFQDNDQKLLDLLRETYLVQEARYNATGKYAAFSEGSTGLDGIPFVYEWITTADGRMWVNQIVSQQGVITEVHMVPVIYFKVAVGLQAIYSTSYTQNMVNHLVSQLPYPAKGYNQGVDENGRVLLSNNIGVSNSFIITAARYALEHKVTVQDPQPVLTPSNPAPSATPMPNPTQNPQSTDNTTPTPPAPSAPTQDPTVTCSPSSTPVTSQNQNQISGQSSNIPIEYLVISSAVITAVAVLVTVSYRKRVEHREKVTFRTLKRD
jgi:hypothetical protein